MKTISVEGSLFRAISTQYPPIDLFENLCESEERYQACLWEMYSNERLRNVIIPYEDCVFGNGASYVMAPFFYKTPPGRFSTELFGCYYGAIEEITSIYEKAHHLGEFYASTEDEAFSEGIDILILKSSIAITLHDLSVLPDNDPIYDQSSYSYSQEVATSLHEKNSNGVYYKSVRHKGGFCMAVFKPKKVPIPIQTKKIPLHFDGKKIDKFFDNEVWNIL